MDDRFAAGRAALVAAILDGDAATAPAARRAAYEGTPATPAVAAYVETVRRHAYRVTDDHVAALRAEGLDDPAIFELTVAAAVGQAGRQYAAALAALAALPEDDA